MASTAGPSTKAPRWRTAGMRTARIRNATTATSTMAVANSYMLPQGSRPTDRPRATRTPMWVSAPSAVTATPSRPHRRLDAGSGATSPGPCGGSGTPPAATSSCCGTADVRRPNASCAQKASTATEYSATLIEKRWSESAERFGSGVTRSNLRCGCTGVQRCAQIGRQGLEARTALPAAPRERGDAEHGTAVGAGAGGPGEHPLPAQQEHAEQAEQHRHRRAQDPVLARVVRELHRGELTD